LGVQRRTGLPAIVSAYGYDVSEFPRVAAGLGGRYLRRVFAHVDLVLAMSEDMRADLLALRCPDDKVGIHYYGSDTARFRHPGRVYDGAGPLNVLCCARLAKAKGQHLVLAALRRLERPGRRDFRVTLVGDGPARRDLERMAADHGWGDVVTFTGHIPYGDPALVEHFRRADVFAHPSITVRGLKEGIPGTIVEAMASGLPVVATRHAGIPAVVEDGRDGLLVAEGDVEGLAAALEACLRDARLRQRLGRSAAARAARELDLHVRTRALERIYDELIGVATPSRGRQLVPS
jgi:colanic acid/amylovoran biosynthesis glycosyltransferase